MKILLDTNICIAHLKGDSAVKSRLLSKNPEDVVLCSVVKAELLFGARNSHRVEANLQTLATFFAAFKSLPFDDRGAEFYGVLRTQPVREDW